MRCPRCEDGVLEERDRHGVVVDHCPGCRGVWLDRGELEKISRRMEREDEDDDDGDGGDPGGPGGRRGRRRGWMESFGDLFD